MFLSLMTTRSWSCVVWGGSRFAGRKTRAAALLEGP